ncbi:MAG: MarR family transcriptional regulator [Pseudomonadota bacterium]
MDRRAKHGAEHGAEHEAKHGYGVATDGAHGPIDPQSTAEPAAADPPSVAGNEATSAADDAALLTAMIERLFFAYRDFTSEADARLQGQGFGRAHHRVIYFVTRHPGLAVHDLLDILRITKQSLARVLRQLVKEGYIEQRKGHTDRRERRLYPTQAGIDLARSLTETQTRKVASALSEAGPDAVPVVTAFLSGMVSDGDRCAVEQLISSTGRTKAR